MISKFPRVIESKIDPELEARIALIQTIVIAIRNLRSENLVPAATRTDVTLIPDDPAAAGIVTELRGLILSPPQVQMKELRIAAPGAAPDPKALTRRCGPVQVCVHVAGVVNPDEEIARIDKDLKKFEAELKKVEGKLGSETFLAKAPEDVVAKQKAIREELVAKLETLTETRKRMEALKN